MLRRSSHRLASGGCVSSSDTPENQDGPYYITSTARVGFWPPQVKDKTPALPIDFKVTASLPYTSAHRLIRRKLKPHRPDFHGQSTTANPMIPSSRKDCRGCKDSWPGPHRDCTDCRDSWPGPHRDCTGCRDSWPGPHRDCRGCRDCWPWPRKDCKGCRGFWLWPRKDCRDCRGCWPWLRRDCKGCRDFWQHMRPCPVDQEPPAILPCRLPRRRRKQP